MNSVRPSIRPSTITCHRAIAFPQSLHPAPARVQVGSSTHAARGCQAGAGDFWAGCGEAASLSWADHGEREAAMSGSLKQVALAAARAAGFDVARVTTPAAIDALTSDRLAHFLERGRPWGSARVGAPAARRRQPVRTVPRG